MALDLTTFDPAEYLDDAESLAAYLEDALEDSDPSEFLEALGVVARARGMTDVAKDAGVARPALYRSLKASGHPDFATVMSVMRSLGVAMHVAPMQPVRRRKRAARLVAKRQISQAERTGG